MSNDNTDIEKLFEPFQITSNKSTSGEKSTGLGILIVKNVIVLHKGELKVESVKEKGSNFIF